MKQVNRKEFLEQLESVEPGLNPREIVEQSSCIVFRDGRVFTYNDDVACSNVSCLKNVEGAVAAKPLISILRKLTEEVITVEFEDEALIIKGKRKKATIRMESEILQGFDVVDLPTKESKWKPIPEKFHQAVNLVRQSASTDESHFSMTCVHIAPEWIEASDNYQITRYTMSTGLKKSMLVRHEAMKEVGDAVMQDWAVTESWIHFRNENGLTLSCRQFSEEFPDMDAFINMKGSALKLPKALIEITDRAEVFSIEEEHNEVIVTLQKEKLRIQGEGPNGKYVESRKVPYKGKAIKFTIAPSLLASLTEKYDKCEVSASALKIVAGRLTFVSSLGVIEDG